MSWKNRIVGHGEQAAISFMANPLNWRISNSVLLGKLRKHVRNRTTRRAHVLKQRIQILLVGGSHRADWIEREKNLLLFVLR